MSQVRAGERPSFFASNGNGFPCIAAAFARRGYRRLAFTAHADLSFAIRWVQHPLQARAQLAPPAPRALPPAARARTRRAGR